MKDKNHYLEGFEDRLLSLSVPYILSTYAKNSEKEYRRKAGMSPEQFFLFVHYVLLFIEEQAVNNYICTRVDIANELKRLNEEMFNYSIEDYDEMARDIVTACIQGHGKGLAFETYSISKKKHEDIYIKLVQDELLKDKGQDYISFSLTPEGMKYIYSTRELKEISGIEYQQIMLIKAFESNNFKMARERVDALVREIERQRRIILSDKKRVLSDIMSVDIGVVIKNISNSYSLIKNQNSENRRIMNFIHSYKQTDKGKDIELWQKVQRNSGDIGYAENKLQLVIERQLELMDSVQGQLEALNNINQDTSFISDGMKFNIIEDIIKPLEKMESTGFNPFRIISSLFYSKPKKISLQRMFERQAILKDRETLGDTTMDGPDNDQIELDASLFEQVAKYNKLYEDMFSYILDKVVQHGSIEIKDIVENSILCQDVSVTKVILAILMQENGKMTFIDDVYAVDDMRVVSFDPMVIAKKHPRELTDTTLLIQKKPDEFVEITSCDNTDEFQTVLKMPNIKFSLVKGGETHE